MQPTAAWGVAEKTTESNSSYFWLTVKQGAKTTSCSLGGLGWTCQEPLLSGASQAGQTLGKTQRVLKSLCLEVFKTQVGDLM